jgi:hypothetical protein
MSLLDYFQNEIATLMSHFDMNYNYKLSIGYNCCMARKRDYKKYDINNRCKNPSVSNTNLCKKCIINTSYGLVNEQLEDTNKLYKTYKKKNPHFVNQYKEARLFREYDEEDFKDFARKNDKRISKLNTIMQTSTDVQLLCEKLNDFISLEDVRNIDVNDISAMHKIIITKKNSIVKNMKVHLTIAEAEEFYEKIMNHIKNLLDDDVDSIEDKISNAEIITLNDGMKQADLFMIKYEDKHNPYHLYYKTKSGYNHVGYARNWIDKTDDVPNEHKNYEGIVLDEDTQLPVLEVDITDIGSLLIGIPMSIYREWEYDDDVEQFRRTNYIERM